MGYKHDELENQIVSYFEYSFYHIHSKLSAEWTILRSQILLGKEGAVVNHTMYGRISLLGRQNWHLSIFVIVRIAI